MFWDATSQITWRHDVTSQNTWRHDTTFFEIRRKNQCKFFFGWSWLQQTWKKENFLPRVQKRTICAMGIMAFVKELPWCIQYKESWTTRVLQHREQRVPNKPMNHSTNMNKIKEEGIIVWPFGTKFTQVIASKIRVCAFDFWYCSF